MLQWPGQISDLNPIEMLWWALTKSVHKQMSTNLNELKQHCEEWAKIPPQQCERLIKSYRQHLLQVISAKSGSKGIES